MVSILPTKTNNLLPNKREIICYSVWYNIIQAIEHIIQGGQGHGKNKKSDDVEVKVDKVATMTGTSNRETVILVPPIKMINHMINRVIITRARIYTITTKEAIILV